jgi:hypothetical protein
MHHVMHLWFNGSVHFHMLVGDLVSRGSPLVASASFLMANDRWSQAGRACSGVITQF